MDLVIMKNHILAFVFLIAFPNLYAQLFDINHIVDTDIGNVQNLRSGDFDSDGDQDLLTITSQLMVWYPNLDGLGNFGEPITLDMGRGISFYQSIVDLDGDGKDDILVSYLDLGIIAFYRNLGDGQFAPLEVLASGLNDSFGISPGDIDGDGDIDLVLGIANGVGFYWIEQLSNGTFGPLQLINNTLSEARAQKLGDIDGDGDLDILTNSVGGILLSWFENVDGQGDFSEHHIIETNGSYETWFHLVDLDGDGDLDNLSEKFTVVFWRENLDGLGTFGPTQTLFSNTDGTPDFNSLQFGDLDNDSDFDIVFDSNYDFGKVYLMNIDGQGTFGSANFIDPPQGGTTGNNIPPVDIDGDGDLDLINTSFFTSTNSNDLYWYENRTILGVKDNNLEGRISINPNPVRGSLFITSNEPIVSVRIYDMSGRRLYEGHENTKLIDISSLPTGLLFVKVKIAAGTIVKKVVKE
jgi:hypothetical protein